MRKIIFLFLFTVILFSSSSSVSFAKKCPTDPICPGVIVTDIGLNTEAWIDYALQGYQLAKETITSIQVTATQINTFKTMYDQTIGRPLKDAMTLMAIAKDADQILNLVNGSTGGDSLLIANPEEYIKNKGLSVLRESYTQAEANGGLYADSFLNNIVATARNSVDTASISKSSIPSTVQNAFCDDTTLSQFAKNEVSENNTVEYTEEEYKSRKAYLNKELCTNDPTKDKATAEKLLAVSKQNPSLGMWDNWLAITNGDNEYARKIKKETAIEQQVKDKQAYALQDMNNGRGIRSATICVEYDEKMQCTKEEVINPAGAISDAFSKAKTAAMDTAISTFGTGGAGDSFFSEIGGILSLAGDAFNAYNQVSGAIGEITGTIDQVTGAFNDISGSVNGAVSEFDKLSGINTANYGGDTTLTARRSAPSMLANASKVVGSSYTQDLASYPDSKTNLINPIKSMLNAHLSAVNELTKIDNDYISKINYYKSLVEGVKTCYLNVESYARNYASSTPYANYSTPQSVLNFYSHEMQVSNNLISTLTNEINVTVPQAKSVIQDTLTKITASNSSMEIFNLTNNYNNIVDSNGLPSLSSSGTRTSEYQLYSNTVDSSTMEGRSITAQNTACTAADTAVKNAIIERDRPVY